MDNLGKLYTLSGIANTVGLLVFNRFYTSSSALASLAPSVLSVESQLLINLWGLAYISTAKEWKKNPSLSFVFFMEKMLYVHWWYKLIIQDTALRNEAIDMVVSGSDILTGSFYLVFGLNDFLSGLVFAAGAYFGSVECQKDKSK